MRIFFFLSFFTLSLMAEQFSTSPSIELGYFVPSLSGTIENTTSKTDFVDDLDYNKSQASYGAIDIPMPLVYFQPHAKIAYFEMRQNENSTLASSKEIAQRDYNGSINSETRYRTFSFLVAKDFYNDGLLGNVDFQIGLNVKYILWNFHIHDLKKESWIRVKEFLPLPYASFAYSFYRFTLFGAASAIAYNSITSISYDAGLRVKLIEHFSIQASKYHEEFSTTEKRDNVSFQADGIKASLLFYF